MLRRLLMAMVLTGIMATTAIADEGARKELLPTGTLRVAIAVSPSPSAFWATTDAATGQPKGVTLILGRALAQKLGAPVELVTFPSSGEIVKAADAGRWDVTFLPVDAERKKALAFAAPYHLLQSTYLVAPGSAVASIAEANRAGFRIGGVDNTATFRASQRASANATHVVVAKVEEGIAKMKAGELDALALSRESLSGLTGAVPGARVLDGGFLNSTTAAAVPNGKAAAQAYVRAFVEEAKASGLVRRAFDELGLTVSVVAPAGMEP